MIIPLINHLPTCFGWCFSKAYLTVPAKCACQLQTFGSMLPTCSFTIAEFLLLLKWQAHSHWRNTPDPEISDTLPLWTTAAGGSQCRVADYQSGSGGGGREKNQPAERPNQPSGPVERAWREGAGDSAEAGSHRNQTAYLPSLPLWTFEMLASMQPEHGFKSTCKTLVFSHTSDVHWQLPLN